MPPLTLTAFVDREARYLGGYLGGAAVKAAAAAPNKRPPSSGGRGVNVNPDVSAIVSAIEMDAAYGSRPSSSASSVRSPVISPDCLDPRRFQYMEDLALHASAHNGAASSLPHRYAADRARDLQPPTVARHDRDRVREDL